MLKNYLKIAWRNIRRNRVNSVIHMAGLGTGMACVLLIAMYVQDERQYDKFFKKADRLFQVNSTGTDNGIEFTTGNTAPAVGVAMVNAYAEVEACARIYRPGDALVRREEAGQDPAFFTEKGLMAVDSNFLQVFSYALVQGNAAACLQNPASLVITEATAKKYFGTENPVGKTLLLDNDRRPFAVTAVLKNIPSQSSFQFDMLVPIRAYSEVKKRSWNWFWLQVATYVKLKDNVSTDKDAVARLEAKFPALVKAHAFQRQDQTYEQFVQKGGKLSYHLLPFTDVHLYANRIGATARLTTTSDVKYIYIFSVIGLFVLLLACVNFMNLSTAQSVKRAKEVGVRKVLGSGRPQLIRQFLTETLAYSVTGLLLSFVLVLLLLKPFNEITDKSLSFGFLFSSGLWILGVGLCLLTGLLAGLYPAFYLTSFRPAAVLKGGSVFKTAPGNPAVRNGLVVFQFTVSIALIICTGVVFRQLQYTRHKDLGLDKENVVVVANTKRLKNSEEVFRREVMKGNGVMAASISSSIPTKVNFGDGYVPEQSETDKPLLREVALSSFMVDEGFLPTYKMQLLSGRNFSKTYADSASVILNETAAKMIGWKEAVGKTLDYPGNSQRFNVIAVVKDFNVSSLRERVEPFALFYTASKTYGLSSSYVSVRLQGGNVNRQLAELESKWKAFAPATPFDYSFLDDDFDALYRSEQRMGTAFGVFTALSIFIACLGLFGLSVYTAARRTKEIGVRKVLGATVPDVVTLLSKDFLKLVMLAAVIAFPLAWWAMNGWLDDFAYRVSIGPGIFVTAAVAALVIALITMSFQAIKAATANPVKSLRTE